MRKLLAVFFVYCFWINFVSASDVVLKNLGKAPVFVAADQDAHQFDSSTLIGKISLVNFFFTSCEGPCPVLMSKVKLVLDKVKSCNKASAVSITVDPDTDTPIQLKSYSEKRGYSYPNWTLLKMEKEKVVDLINNGFHLGQGDSVISHTTRMAIVDQTGNIRALVGGNDEDATDKLSSTILELCK